MDLTKLLSGYNKTALNTIAKTLGVALPIRERDELVAAIAKRLQDPVVVYSALDQLAPNERGLLELVQAAGGEMSVGALRLLAKRNDFVDDEPRPRSAAIQPGRNTRIFENVAARLVSYGMLLTNGKKPYSNALHDFELVERAIIPEQILKVLPPIGHQQDALRAPTPPPTIRSADPATFQRDLYLYWSYLRDNAVPLTTRGLIGKPNLKKINATLSQHEDVDALRDETDAGRLRFLRGVLSACDLVHYDGTRLQPAPNAEEFFARPLAQRVHAAFQAYRNGSFWDELLRIPNVAIEGRRATELQAHAAVVHARNELFKLLARVPSSGWVSVAAFEELVGRLRYEFLLPRKRNPWGYGRNELINPYEAYGNELGWSFRSRSPGELYGGFIQLESDGWNIVEAGLIAAMLREPLHWLGLLDLGLAPDTHRGWPNTLEALRATPFGAHELMGADAPAEEASAGGRLIVQPTFQVLAYPPVSELQLALLDRIAERSRLEQVAEYRLTRESLYRARQQHGLSIEQVVADLERESGAALPQNVAYTLLEWGRAQDRVLLHDRVTLLRVDDASVLDQLVAQGALAASRRLSANALFVASEDQGKLEQALFALGQLPLLVDRPPDLEGGGYWLRASPDGALELLSSAPRLYLQPALRAFALPEGDRWRITAASVRQAAADGTPPDRLIERLQAWTAENVPPELERQIKAWGGLFGTASIEQPTLLRLSDERALQALREDAEISLLLRPIAQPELLAAVDPAHLSRLLHLLAERGVQVSSAFQQEAPSTPVEAAKKRGRLGTK